MGLASVAETSIDRAAYEEARFEAYQRWSAEQQRDPKFASVRMLVDDLRSHGRIHETTWPRFDDEELAWAAEILNAPHTRVDRFRFDGQDIIVKESDGVNPAITLRRVYVDGLRKTQEDVAQEPGLIYQLHRDKIFMDFYEAVERMMRGETDYDTIHMASACPMPHEVADDPQEAERLLKLRHYDIENRTAYDYTARKLPGNQLEMSATRHDSSDLRAFSRLHQEYGYAESEVDVPSHFQGQFLAVENTGHLPIEVVIGQRAKILDTALEELTGQKHYHGRTEDLIDAHDFLQQHCSEHLSGYKAFNELLARHIAGEPLNYRLKDYLLTCLFKQEAVEKSVLSVGDLYRLRVQLEADRVTPDMAMACRELLIYDFHATISARLKLYLKGEQLPEIEFSDGDDFMSSYAEDASDNGAEAAARGEDFSGCETATEVNSLAQAAQLALDKNMSLEEVLRMRQTEREWRRGDCRNCLRKDGVFKRLLVGECGLCKDCENAHNEHGDAGLESRRAEALAESEEPTIDKEPEKTNQRRLVDGVYYMLDGRVYRYSNKIIIGGAEPEFTTNKGQLITGAAARQLELILSQEI